MDEAETEQLLYNAAVAQAIGDGFRLGDGADEQIRGYARTAAREIVAASGEGGVRADKVTDGVRAFRLLVDTMISVREDAYREKPELIAANLVGEDTLAMTLGKLCPGFWPFC